jgi:hypothetical protein
MVGVVVQVTVIDVKSDSARIPARTLPRSSSHVPNLAVYLRPISSHPLLDVLHQVAISATEHRQRSYGQLEVRLRSQF